jgi:hypothetical protein
MNFQRFKPHDAVKILADRRRSNELKIWSLARLLSWISLDQRPRRVQKQTAPLCNRMRSRASNAKLAGNVVLASLLYRRPDDRKSLKWIGIFLKSDGFRLILKGPRSPKNWLRELKDVEEGMMHVHSIMSCLCRYKKYGGDPHKLSIEAAKQFVIMKGQKSQSLSKISKTWEPHRKVAPYIFSFVSLFSDTIAQSRSIDELVDRLEAIASNQALIDELLGKAGYATGVLKDIARHVHDKDLKKVTVVEPDLERFTAHELQIIRSIEFTNEENDTGEDYHPTTFPIADIAKKQLAALKATRSPVGSK